MRPQTGALGEVNPVGGIGPDVSLKCGAGGKGTAIGKGEVFGRGSPEMYFRVNILAY